MAVSSKAIGGLITTHIEGGCLCGEVRYQVDAEPTFVGVCHCSDCQRFTGSAFATVVAVPSSALMVSGQMQTFSKRGDSGKFIRRRFCPECGSGLMDEADAMPDLTLINVGTLDDASWVTPQLEIYCGSGQRWVRLDGERKRFGCPSSS